MNDQILTETVQIVSNCVFSVSPNKFVFSDLNLFKAQRRYRGAVLRAMGAVITAPFSEVTFATNVVGDMLTSARPFLSAS